MSHPPDPIAKADALSDRRPTIDLALQAQDRS
jgi:hypothetical protein